MITPPPIISIIDPSQVSEGAPPPVPLGGEGNNTVAPDVYNESGIFIETPNLPSLTVDPVE